MSAAADLGIDGSVTLTSPDANLGGSIVRPRPAYLDSVALLHVPCAARAPGAPGSFVVRSDTERPASPDGPLRAALSGSDLEVVRVAGRCSW